MPIFRIMVDIRSSATTATKYSVVNQQTSLKKTISIDIAEKYRSLQRCRTRTKRRTSLCDANTWAAKKRCFIAGHTELHTRPRALAARNKTNQNAGHGMVAQGRNSNEQFVVWLRYEARDHDSSQLQSEGESQRKRQRSRSVKLVQDSVTTDTHR